MRYAAQVAYDGTEYHGFQRQANAPSVQQALEEALTSISGQSISVVGSGRTDAGVHATGQVIAFSLDWRHSGDKLRSALNTNLPEDIAVSEVWQAPPDFHPRYDAISRSYLYRLYVAPVKDPLQRRLAWHLTTELEVEAIQAASAYLLGTHDFTAFGTPPQGDNPVRTVFEATWIDDAEGRHTFTITANAFLYRMVRTIVGTLALVGQKHMTSDDFRGILAARQRGRAAAPAPAHGLTLVAVNFPEGMR